MLSFTRKISFALLLFLSLMSFNGTICSGSSRIRCHQSDRRILQIFKEGVNDSSNRLSSWSTEQDCCAWKGVHRDNITARVTRLDFHEVSMQGEINLSLLELEFLNYLDLSGNEFETVRYPSTHSQRYHNQSFATSSLYANFSSSLIYLDFSYNGYLHMDNLHWLSLVPSLRYLNLGGIDLHNQTNWLQSMAMLPSLSELRLSSCRLDNISPSLRYINFTSLVTLDLSSNDDLQMDNLHWLSLFPSLKYLDLSGIDLHNQTNWLLSVAMVPSLSELRLRGCQLNPSKKYVNFTSLVTIDLSLNYFESELLDWLFKLSSEISYVGLSHNDFRGQIPQSLLNSRNLKALDLSYNQLNGSIPNWLGELEHLQDLDLSYNLLSGPLPSNLGNVSSLVGLDIRYNRLTGNLPECLGQLSKLESLLIGSNSLTGILSETFFNGLPNLNELDFGNSTFVIDLDPNWIPPFQLHILNLRHLHLGPNFPSWIYTQRSIKYLDISGSRISSIVEDKFWNLTAGSWYLDLSNNSISGDLSNVLLNAEVIILAFNNFKGRLPHISANVTILDISHNSFAGSMFPLLCHSRKWENNMGYLDISNNLLSGNIPNCWANWKGLSFIRLESNQRTGEISSLGSLPGLGFIDLHNNNLSGRIPTLRQQEMVVLKLSSNKLTGNIPSQLCQLTRLIILDLANNKFSGSLPQCISNITAMANNDYRFASGIGYGFTEKYRYMIPGYKVMLNIKGLELEYAEERQITHIIDLSTNNLTGIIPPKLFKLIELVSLNLSHNDLVGKIPMDIGGMKNLESLELSDNKLSGEIPQSISNLNFLSYINLSYNDFSGQIPSGSQLQTFEAWSYIHNPQLCGAPLTKNCPKKENPIGEEHEEPGTESWFYLGMGVGFSVGFWGVCGAIFFIRAFRHAYFLLIDRVADKIYVVAALRFNMFR